MKNSIALIGFMGTGKTVAGKILAVMLGKEFIELDALIEKKAGKSIAAIFHDEGEIRFRELEIEAAAEVAVRKNAVLACGGGIVLNKINIDRLARNYFIVCLTASPTVILKRTAGGGRPLLNVGNRKDRIDELIKLRRPYYQHAADITINTSRLTQKAVARKIMEKVREYEGFDK